MRVCVVVACVGCWGASMCVNWVSTRVSIVFPCKTPPLPLRQPPGPVSHRKLGGTPLPNYREFGAFFYSLFMSLPIWIYYIWNFLPIYIIYTTAAWRFYLIFDSWFRAGRKYYIQNFPNSHYSYMGLTAWIYYMQDFC